MLRFYKKSNINFRYQNNPNNFNRRFQNNFDRRNLFTNKNSLWQLRKQPLKIQGNEEHQDKPIPQNIPEHSLVNILAAIHSRTSSTETIIVPQRQQTNESFIL